MSGFRVDPTVYDGPPADCPARERAVYDFLSTLPAPYRRASHDVITSHEEAAAVENVLDVAVCKNLFLCNRQKTQYYMLMIPAPKPLRTRDLSDQLGCARLSFGDSDALLEKLNTIPGGVSLLSLIFDPEQKVRLIIDREVMEHEFFGCNPCSLTSTLRFRTDDFWTHILPALGHEPTYITL